MTKKQGLSDQIFILFPFAEDSTIGYYKYIGYFLNILIEKIK